MSTQPILLIDIGNTAIKWSLYYPAKANTTEIQGQFVIAQKIYPENIASDFFITLWSELETPGMVLVSCVAHDSVLQLVQHASQQLWSLAVNRAVSGDKNFSFLNCYKDPAQLGDDRFCAMVAGYNTTKTDYIVVDCGSAITIDLVASSGAEKRSHQGGYILPGLSLMKASLLQQTADVKVDTLLQTGSLLPGDTTEKCVDAAICLSAVSLIERVFTQQKNTQTQCILTGGDANTVAKFLSIKHQVIPELVIQGLLYLSRLQQ